MSGRLTEEETIGASAGVFVGIVLLFGAYLGFLHYRNQHGGVSRSVAPPRTMRLKFAVFVFRRFVAHLLIELIGVLFVVLAIVDLESYNAEVEASPPAGWQRSELHNIRIAFYAFQSIKYALVVFALLVEFKYRDLPVRLALKANGFLRADWPAVLYIAVLLPVILMDGMLINTEFFLSDGRDVGDLFEFDSIVLLALDLILFIKLYLAVAQQSHTLGTSIDVKAMAWECVIVMYLVSEAIVFILFQLEEISGGLRLSTRLLIVLTSILLHPIVCAYTSLMAQQIVANDRALSSAPKARVAALLSYVRYFHRTVPAVLVNVFLYAFCFYLYIWPFVLTGIDVSQARDRREPALQVGILTSLIAINVINGFLLLNLAFATLKRVGPYVRLRPPFDCASYAQAVNTILSECNANFRCDSHMQVRNV
jgi:hypothetical protein